LVWWPAEPVEQLDWLPISVATASAKLRAEPTAYNSPAAWPWRLAGSMGRAD
jgi:hypothetical protein